MDSKELSMPGIYRSIESTLSKLKSQLSEIQSSAINDVEETQKTIATVLIPASDMVKLVKIDNLLALKKLLSLIQSTQRPVSPLFPSKFDRKKDFAKHETRTKLCQFPPVPIAHPVHLPKCRAILPTGVRYPSINHLVCQNSNGTKFNFSSVTSDAHCFHKPAVSSSKSSADIIKELISFYDCIENIMSRFQEMFTVFSQRILVPLQTFCKHTRSRPYCKIKDEAIENDSESKFLQNPKDVHQCEFVVVQTMNEIKQLLWPPTNGTMELVSSHEISFHSRQHTSSLSNYERFPIVRIIPTVTEKFLGVLNCASSWQKRDELYTENAKAGLQRATRRYKKTERMWKEARHEHRQLCSELNHTCRELDTNILRLNTLQNEVENLKEDLCKCNDEQQTVETKLSDCRENPEHLKIQHRALKRRSNLLNRKVEIKERNFDFMNSRIRSFKADRDAVAEKIRINEEFSNSLQETMTKFFQHKEAWRRRYLEKTDEKFMRKKMLTIGLRIPSPTVRERTFILKTRKQNLHDAIEIVSERLKESNIHWTALCSHLTWPNEFFVTLQNIGKSVQSQTNLKETPPSILLSHKSEEKASIPSICDIESGVASIDLILDFVKRNVQGTEKEECLFMLRLWLHHNGQHASLEHLVKALQAARMSDTAMRLAKLSSR